MHKLLCSCIHIKVKKMVPLRTLSCLVLGAVLGTFSSQWQSRWRRTRRQAGYIVPDRLSAGKHEVADLDLCKVFLMDDATYPCWLVLVPKQDGLTEVTDLSEADQQQLWREVARCSQAVRRNFPCDKLNIATLGNVVSDLHVHVTARLVGDAAWPGPCYGAHPAKPFAPEERERIISVLYTALQAS